MAYVTGLAMQRAARPPTPDKLAKTDPKDAACASPTYARLVARLVLHVLDWLAGDATFW